MSGTSPRATRTALLAAIGSISVVGLATGITLPLVSLRLTHQGASLASIAALAALPAVGTLAISLVLPALTRRFGSQALLRAALLLSCASMLVLITPYALLPWTLSRLGTGVATGILFALGEARILEYSASAARGRWTGAYATTLTACQLAGPTLLALLGPQSPVPIVFAAALHLCAMALLGKDPSQRLGALAAPQPFRGLLRGSLPLAVAVLFFSMFDSTVLSLLPLYGLALGLPARLAVLMVSVVLLGDTLLQVPVGWAADRIGRQRVHAACGALACLSALALASALLDRSAIWVALLLMGGAAGSLYTLAIVRLGDRFRGAELVAANSGVSFLWGAGSLAGPVLGSACMQIAKPQGLMLFVAAGTCAFLLSLLGSAAAAARSPA